MIWIILRQGVRYEERGPAVNERSKRKRTLKMIRELRSLGYQVEPLSVQPAYRECGGRIFDPGITLAHYREPYGLR